MKLHWCLLLLSLLGLVFVHKVRCEVPDDDGDVEVEEESDTETSEPPREKPVYKKPVPKGNAYFAEPFHSKEEFKKKWILSQAKKDGVEEQLSKYDGKWELEEAKENAFLGDLGLILKSKAKHHAIAANLDKPFEFHGKPFIVQYEVKFQNGLDCGGAYVKLLSKQNKVDLKSFHDKTPYTVMFGPDKCGLDHKLHFIFRHKNPKTGEIEEKHAKKPTANIDSYFTDKKTHLYALVVNPDNSFEIRVDDSIVNSGNLLEDFTPPVNPPKEIEDPKDKKPADWDEREKIPDPDATKPDDWDESEPENIPDPDAVKPEGWLDDEPQLVPDPAAEKPTDWDDDMDGEWEAPLIDNVKCKEAPGCGKWERPTIKNPNYKGKWSAPIIENPNYKGIWKPQVIPNPNFFEDLEPYKMTPISAVGLELWSMSDEILFDNFLITDEQSVAEMWAADSWAVKNVEERTASATGGIWHTLKSAADERKWLWAVYVVVLLLPIVLLSICLCPRSGPVKQEDVDAQRKKTDEPSPDDEQKGDDEGAGDKITETVEEKKEETVGADGDNSGATKKSTKADLEASEGKDDEGDEGDEGDEADSEDEVPSGDSPRKSPRKRKTRKD